MPHGPEHIMHSLCMNMVPDALRSEGTTACRKATPAEIHHASRAAGMFNSVGAPWGSNLDRGSCLRPGGQQRVRRGAAFPVAAVPGTSPSLPCFTSLHHRPDLPHVSHAQN
jgi:hypothetical protein